MAMQSPCVRGFVGEPAAPAPWDIHGAPMRRADRVQAPLRSCTQSESW